MITGEGIVAKVIVYKSCDEPYGTEFEIWAGFGPVGSTENCPTKTLL